MVTVEQDLLNQVDPELRIVLESAPAWDPEIGRQDIAMIRKISNERASASPCFADIQPDFLEMDYKGHRVSAFVYASDQSQAPSPCLIWFHGGGYVMGRARDNWFPTLFCAALGCTVVSVDYGLAPEKPAPAGIHDGFAALNWVAENAAKLGIDPDRIAIGGLSAGGGLAASVALYNRDRNGFQPCLQLLLCPMLDYLHDTPSGRQHGHPIWNRKNSIAAWKLYLGTEPTEETLSYASPSHAKTLRGLPPTYMAVGEVDLSLDENRKYAKDLLGAGVECEFHSFPGVFHAGEAAGYSTKIGQKMNTSHLAALAEAFNLTREKAEFFHPVARGNNLMTNLILNALRGGLVASCQPVDDGPLDHPEIVAALAAATLDGGAAGVRIEGVDNVRATRARISAPIIAIVKEDLADSPVRITPRVAQVQALADAGADIIAYDATDRPRPDHRDEILAAILSAGKIAMADCSTLEDGKSALAGGAQILGTTLSGYTDETSTASDAPDYALVSNFKKLGAFVMAEGRYNTPNLAAQAMAHGADAVTVGTALTRLEVMTKSFVDAIRAD